MTAHRHAETTVRPECCHMFELVEIGERRSEDNVWKCLKCGAKREGRFSTPAAVQGPTREELVALLREAQGVMEHHEACPRYGHLSLWRPDRKCDCGYTEVSDKIDAALKHEKEAR